MSELRISGIRDTNEQENKGAIPPKLAGRGRRRADVGMSSLPGRLHAQESEWGTSREAGLHRLWQDDQERIDARAHCTIHTRTPAEALSAG